VVLIALTEDDPLEAISVLLQRVYYLIIPLSVVAIKFVRNIGVGYTWDGTEEMWIGLTKDKNNLGQIAVICAVVCVWQILRNWPRKKLSVDWLALIPALWLLRGSPTAHSSTAIVGFAIGAAGLFGLQLIKRRAAQAKRIIRRATIGFLVLAPAINIGLALFDTSPANVLFETTGRNATFTDRTFLWKDLLDTAAKSPVLGVGFGAFWVGPVGYDLYPMPNWSSVTHTWRPGEGHNGFIDVYIELGVVGLGVLLMVILFAFTGALRDLQSEFEFGRLRLIILVSILVNNLTESSLLDGTHSYWCLFLLVAVNIPARYLSRLKPETVRRSRSMQYRLNESAGTTVGASRLSAAGRIH
jgi:O-antigen ligase